MDWSQLIHAVALVMIIEGIMPFLAPGRWRLLLMRVASMDERALRTAGLVSMVVGLLVLRLVA